MATTIPTEWHGHATLTEDKVADLKAGHRESLGDADKASDMDDACYWQGRADALAWVLDTLYDVTPKTL